MKYDRIIRWLPFALLGVLLLSGIMLVISHQKHGSASAKIPVTATFYPMAEFTRQVGGDRIQVTTLIQPGVEPHDYDPSPQDIAAIYRSKAFIYNGAGLERWVDRIQNDIVANHVESIQASRGIALKASDGSDSENASSTDPHIWMDPVLAQQEVRTIESGLGAIDPGHQATYHANAQRYLAQLAQLDHDFRSGLQGCELHDIVTSHQAFRYLAADYGLQATGIAGLSPDDEPSPQKLADIASLVKAKNIRYIFFETLVSPKLAQTIASETGAQTIAFNPLEGLTNNETKQGKNYISVQRDNLRALQIALHCKQ